MKMVVMVKMLVINGDGSIKKMRKEERPKNSENCPFRKVLV